MSEENEEYIDKIAKICGNILSQTVNEAIVLNQLEGIMSPKLTSLAKTKSEEKAIQERMLKLQRSLGGIPKLIIKHKNKPAPRYDTYPVAAINEIISTYHRCRKSLCRTHLYYVGVGLVKDIPDTLKLPKDPEMTKNTIEAIFDSFWGHAETTYIRLASLWDRIGQLLDFVFFNIRQYERDGFSNVMNRIMKNYIPLSKELSNSEHWRKLRSYQNSEKTDGFGWLLKRRNILIHSLHLKAFVKSEGKDPIYISEYNHLDEKERKNLAPGTTTEELNYLHSHFSKAVKLFDNVFGICELGTKIFPRK